MGRLNFYRTRSIKFETVAKIRDKQAAKLLSNDHVCQEFAGSVIVWLNYKGGQLHRFYWI
jgi:hypothetical protein